MHCSGMDVLVMTRSNNLDFFKERVIIFVSIYHYTIYLLVLTLPMLRLLSSKGHKEF